MHCEPLSSYQRSITASQQTLRGLLCIVEPSRVYPKDALQTTHHSRDCSWRPSLSRTLKVIKWWYIMIMWEIVEVYFGWWTFESSVNMHIKWGRNQLYRIRKPVKRLYNACVLLVWNAYCYLIRCFPTQKLPFLTGFPMVLGRRVVCTIWKKTWLKYYTFATERKYKINIVQINVTR